MKLRIGLLLVASIVSTNTALAAPSIPHETALDWCSKGKNQSPINIDKPIEAVLPVLYVGHPGIYDPLTVEQGAVLFPEGHSLDLERDSWSLKEMRLFKPSAHLIHGKASGFEFQLRFQSSDNTLMVSLLVDEGPPRTSVSHLVSALEGTQNETREKFRLNEFLSTRTGYYRYNGSEVVPPCREGVEWLIISRTLTASKSQLEALEKLIGTSTSRAIQPLNARAVLK